MGIDIYALWDGQTDAEHEAQARSFAATAGDVGYLREAYHGKPYATRHLFREVFASPTATAAIHATTLCQRLPFALALVRARERRAYKETDPAAIRDVENSFRAFVELCATKERATGTPCVITASY